MGQSSFGGGSLNISASSRRSAARSLQSFFLLQSALQYLTCMQALHVLRLTSPSLPQPARSRQQSQSRSSQRVQLVQFFPQKKDVEGMAGVKILKSPPFGPRESSQTMAAGGGISRFRGKKQPASQQPSDTPPTAAQQQCRCSHESHVRRRWSAYDRRD